MHKHVCALVSTLAMLTALVCQGQAQSITVSPTMPYVPVSQTVQFTATVSGLSGNSVNWYAGGSKGGNSTAGTISSTGLYTAPANLPAQNPVQITAKSTVNSKIAGTTYVNILAQGPTITAVTPNPLTPGTITVKIKGTPIQSGATAFISFGSYSNIQMSTVSTGTDNIVATTWLGNVSSATFCIKNPGPAMSNTITVPVNGGSAPPPSYVLNVVNGTGGGSYTAGTVVTITANAAPAGQVFSNWTGAAVQNANAATTTLTMPAAATTVTANYATPGTYALTVNGGSGSGSYAPGTVVTITANAAPAGQIFSNWTGATVQNANAASTTLTMPSAATAVTANYVANAPAVPFPVSSHPRLWVTTNDLSRLQSWANNNNPIYKQGMLPLLNQAINIYNTQFFPGGVANPNYPDPGDVQGYQGYLTEQYAIVLAFNSLIDPSSTNRITYAKYARNLLMYAMNQAVLGHQANAPFRDPAFAVYNRANGSGEQWPLIVDWIYNAQDAQGNPILTAQDKLTIRNVFMIWANDCLHASTTGGDSPQPVGVTNSLQLLPNNKAYRMASNNYYLGHARLLTMMALSIDPSDDPPLNSGQSLGQIGNTLRSYLNDANGAWLYQEYAMMGEASTIASDYGIGGNGAGLGMASGGLPPEGMLYGHSFGFVLGQLLALQTAGFNNTAYTGPQAKLISAPVWDRYVKGFLSSLTPNQWVPPTETYDGLIYQFGSYGDLLRLWVTPDCMQSFTLLALLEQENGQTTHLSPARWFAVNAVQGGAPALMTRITDPWSWSSSQSILYYLLMDPAAAAAPDPRPTYANVFFDPPAGRIVAHSDWTPTGTMFDYRASWESINHQVGDGGQFELYRNGEWLTKEMSNYDNNAVGLTTVYHNTLAIQNWCAAGTPNLSWFEAGEWANGSQWMLGSNAGDPTTISSNGPGYVYATSNLTNLYNRPNVWTPTQGATDVTQATRSILWLNNDYVVVYDRATTNHTGLFKRFNLSLENNPTINGNVATEVTDGGQQLFIQTLLPASPSINAAFAASNLSPIADLEPTKFIFTVEDATKPADVRFLHVLQGADPGAAMAKATYLQSTSGTPFDGAVFGSAAVFFPVSAGGQFSATTFTVPAGVHTLMVTGLTANGGYNVSSQTGAGGTIITITPNGAAATADSAGLLKLTF